MNKRESIIENVLHKILMYFEIKTDQPISARRSDIVLISKKEKKTYQLDFAIPADHKINKDDK